MARFELHLGDCLEVLKTMPDNSVDAVVCDPPYGLSFMGRKWDYDVPEVAVWAECLRVLKPGGHLLAFAGTRTQHRMAVRIEDAGFEIRDMIAWVYGSGFPKSLDVSKAIDKARDDSADILRVTTFMADAADRAGVTRADVDAHMGTRDMGGWWLSRLQHRCQCPKWDQWLQLKALLGLSDEMDAEVWRLNGRKGQPGEAWAEREVIGVQKGAMSGWDAGGGTKFVDRDITLPATEAARQWQGWGTALKPALEPITVARKPFRGTVAENVLAHGTGALNIDGCRVNADGERVISEADYLRYEQNLREAQVGRWPANLIHDGSEEVLAGFPQAKGQQGAVTGDEPSSKTDAVYGQFNGRSATTPRGDTGSAARFFYCAKASKRDRGEDNAHPTVKPTDLMAYLCRLVTPPGGVVLDPFMGSGSTGKAAVREGFRFIGIEREAKYLEIARARISAVAPEVRCVDDLI